MQLETLSFDICTDLDAAREAIVSWAESNEDPGQLADHLYQVWYQDGGQGEAKETWPQVSHYVAAVAPFMHLQDGWRIERIEHGQLGLINDEGNRVASSWRGVAPTLPLAPLRPGTQVSRFAPLNAEVNGFWHLWSDGWQRQVPDAVVRLYLPLEHGAEGDAARVLVANAPVGASWAAKMLCGEHQAGRRDPALIYLPSGDQSAPWVMSLLDRMSPLFSASRVRLTQLWHGSWLAADPGEGRSFGQAVCEALATLSPEIADNPDRFRAEAFATLRPLLPHLEVS